MTLGTADRPFEILLAEDNPGDVRLTQEILKDSQFKLNISVAEDGEVALAYLRRRGRHSRATRPHLLLLDLAMPKKSGYEVLDEMSTDPNLRNIPIVVLSSTRAERAPLYSLYSYDISPSPSLLGLYQKPVDLARFDTLIGQIIAAQTGEASFPG